MATRILYLCALLCASSSIALRLERDDLLTFPDVGRLFLWIVAMGSLAVFCYLSYWKYTHKRQG